MNHPSRTISKAFADEWEGASKRLLTDVADLTDSIGMSPQAQEYIQTLRAYPRFPYVAALWICDPHQRLRIGTALCMHAIGLKLLDNILDDDTGLSRFDLALGAPIVDEAYVRLLREENGCEVVRRLCEKVSRVWRSEVYYSRTPPTDLCSWLDYVEVKSGLLMSAWAEAACFAAGLDSSCAESFCRAYCMLLQFANDAHGYSNGEKTGNLGYMLAQGSVTVDETRGIISALVSEAQTALHKTPAVYPLSTLVESAVARWNAFIEGTLESHRNG